MANTTFSGSVRSENGFKVINVAATTGVVTETSSVASTGIFTNKYLKHVGYATGVTVNTTAGDSPAIGAFTQPANTIMTNIKIFCATAPVIGSGNIGYEVGTSSSGAQIVAAVADQILDGGTTVVVGNVTLPSLVAQTESAPLLRHPSNTPPQQEPSTAISPTRQMPPRQAPSHSLLSMCRLHNRVGV